MATAGTDINDTSFKANWNTVNYASKYKVDVSNYPTFSTLTPDSVAEEFNNGLTPPAGWSFGTDTPETDTVIYGQASPSIEFNSTGQDITTAIYKNAVTKLSFFLQGSNNVSGSLLVEGFDGYFWKIIDNISAISNQPITKMYDGSSSPALEAGFKQFRFTANKKSGRIYLDDIVITYNYAIPSYLPGYFDTAVLSNSLTVAGIQKNNHYYYRVRAVGIDIVSGNSNTIEVINCTKPIISGISAKNLNCNNDSSGSINITATGGNLAYSWIGPANFSSPEKNIQNLAAGNYKLSVTSYGGCNVDTIITITEPPALFKNDKLL